MATVRDNETFVLRVLDALQRDLAASVIAARSERDVRDTIALTLQNYADRLGVPSRARTIGFTTSNNRRTQ